MGLFEINLPHGYIIETANKDDSFMVYGELNRNRNNAVVKGFKLFVPNLNHGSNELKNSLYREISSYLQRIEPSKRIQFKWERDSDYNDIIDQYDRDTELYADEFCKYARERISKEIHHSIDNNIVKRDYLYLYISKEVHSFLPSGFDVSNTILREKFEKVVIAFFNNEFINLKSAFSFKVQKMTHVDMYKNIYRTANKSAQDHTIDYEQSFSELINDVYNCEYTGLTMPIENKVACFVADGYFHTILKVKEFPAFTLYPFYGNSFFASDIPNIAITTNIQMQDIDKVIEKKQKHLKRLKADLIAEPDEVALANSVDELEEEIYSLGSREDIPCLVEMIIHIWDTNLESLQANISAIQQVGITMQIPLMLHELGMQSLVNYTKTFPGNLFHPRWSEALDCNHSALAALIPMSTSFVGAPEFQALFWGDHDNIVGISPFLGDTPNHSVMMGQSGAGKSVTTLGELLQIFCFYKKIVIIEEGLSYLMFTRLFGGMLIEIDANSQLVLNPFDTCSIPLTASQMEFVTNFFTAMCGKSSDDSILQKRSAIIDSYVNQCYNDSFMEWRKNHQSDLIIAATWALTIKYMLGYQPTGRDTIIDTFLDLKEAFVKSIEERNMVEKKNVEYFYNIDEMTINNFIIENDNLLRDIAYAFMTKDDMPYLSQFVETIRSTPEEYHDSKDTNDIATLLARYSIESGKNSLFDGITSIDLSNRLIHFELGKMSNSGENFKALVGLVIGNLVKNQIINMPRTDKKLYIFEEAQRFLAVPGADAIMKQSYAQFRKYNCVAWTITQEAGQLAESNVGTIVMSQSKQCYFLKNKDKNNLEYFNNFVRLPESAQHEIMNFPSPESISGRKYSSFMYYVDQGEYPIIGTVRFYASELEIAVASTSGNAFTEREKECEQLSLLYGQLTKGELLILFLKRKKVKNKALTLVNQMIETKTLTQIGELKEAILDLSINQGE